MHAQATIGSAKHDTVQKLQAQITDVSSKLAKGRVMAQEPVPKIPLDGGAQDRASNTSGVLSPTRITDSMTKECSMELTSSVPGTAHANTRKPQATLDRHTLYI